MFGFSARKLATSTSLQAMDQELGFLVGFSVNLFENWMATHLITSFRRTPCMPMVAFHVWAGCLDFPLVNWQLLLAYKQFCCKLYLYLHRVYGTRAFSKPKWQRPHCHPSVVTEIVTDEVREIATAAINTFEDKKENSTLSAGLPPVFQC
jgi:hypothetical protein